MTRLARTERTALCDLALQVGADQPTLCGEWTVAELVAHLVLRERSLLALGLVVPPLSGATDHATQRLARGDFAVLVERVRTGPPVWSPFRVPQVDAAVNTLEYLVHHEDIRRAQSSWSSRSLDERTEQTIWSALPMPAKALIRKAGGLGVTLENTLTGATVDAGAREPRVVVRGRPSELALYVFGRRPQARVELVGDDESVARLSGTPLGL